MFALQYSRRYSSWSMNLSTPSPTRLSPGCWSNSMTNITKESGGDSPEWTSLKSSSTTSSSGLPTFSFQSTGPIWQTNNAHQSSSTMAYALDNSNEPSQDLYSTSSVYQAEKSGNQEMVDAEVPRLGAEESSERS